MAAVKSVNIVSPSNLIFQPHLSCSKNVWVERMRNRCENRYVCIFMVRCILCDSYDSSSDIYLPNIISDKCVRWYGLIEEQLLGKFPDGKPNLVPPVFCNEWTLAVTKVSNGFHTFLSRQEFRKCCCDLHYLLNFLNANTGENLFANGERHKQALPCRCGF